MTRTWTTTRQAGKDSQVVTEPIPIAYLINNFGKGGGTENQLGLLIKNLDKTKFTPHVFALQTYWEDAKFDLEIPVEHLNVDKLASASGLRAFFQFRRRLKELNTRLLQIFFYDSRLFGVPAARLAGVEKIVLSRRDMGWGLSNFDRTLMKTFSRMAHYCLVNAEAVKDMVARTEAFNPDQIEVVHNGILMDEEHEPRPFDLTEFGLPKGKPVVGMVSNLRKVKRIDRFIEMAARLKNRDAHFIVIGWGRQPEIWEQAAEKAGMGNRIHFVQTVYRIIDIVSSFDVAILTSESEGLSNSLIEYAYAGIPAVAFDIGGNAEVIKHDRTGYILPNDDIDGMAEKVDFLLDHDGFRGDMGDEAKKHARTAFSVENMVRKTEEFYDRILKS